MQDKTNRQEAILKIIADSEIETQKDLADALRRLGYEVTQATVSRDIKELRLTKSRIPGGRQRYAAADKTETERSSRELGDKYARVMKDAVIRMDPAGNLLVMHTVSGMAMAAAAAVDAMHLEEVVGCIAGDDTIMIAARTASDAESLMEKLQQMIRR